MRIGGSLTMVAVGAILTFGVTAHVSGLNITAIGLILMLVGIAGLVISLKLGNSRARTDIIHDPGGEIVDADGDHITEPERTTYLEPRDREYEV